MIATTTRTMKTCSRSVVAALLVSKSHLCTRPLLVRCLSTIQRPSSKSSRDGLHPQRFPMVVDEVTRLAQHPAVNWNESASLSNSRKKLKPRHRHLFQPFEGVDGQPSKHRHANATISPPATDAVDSPRSDLDSLFDKFALTLCGAQCVPRKELFETWAAALYIYDHYFMSGEVRETQASITAPSIDSANTATDDGTAANENADAVAPLAQEASMPHVRRICDVAGGHGLLAWALLVLDDYHLQARVHDGRVSLANHTDEESVAKKCASSHTSTRPLTAFCLDAKMPKSADAIEAVMLNTWPQLAGRFDFVEARLEQLRPHPSCLMVAVHACGTLSDLLVGIAATTQSPLALVPCCHTRKKKRLERIAQMSTMKDEYTAIMEVPASEPIPDLGDRLDGIRMGVLEKSGFDVCTQHLPAEFTGRTRVILGSPEAATAVAGEAQSIDADYFWGKPATSRDTSITGINGSSSSRGGGGGIVPRKGRMVPPAPPQKQSAKEKFLRMFDVPCEDSDEGRDTVKQLAGRDRANQRRQALQRKGNGNAPRLDMSMFLPSMGPGAARSMEDWEKLLQSTAHDAHSRMAGGDAVAGGSRLQCVVAKHGDPFTEPNSGRISQTFRFEYYIDIEKSIPFTDEDAKQFHAALYDEIQKAIPEVETRK